MKYKGLFWAVGLLTAVGLIFALLLLHLDYQVRFVPDFVPACNIGAHFDCSVVAKSSYAFFGGLPVAAWGITGYLLVLFFMAFNYREQIYAPLGLIYLLFSGVSLYYFAVSKLQLNAFCLYCLCTYLINWINTLILGVFWIMKRKELPLWDGFKTPLKSPRQLGTYLLTAALVLGLSSCLFDKNSAANNNAESAAPSAAASTAAEPLGTVYPNGRFDVKSLAARAGATDGAVTMILYSDYECPYCAEFEVSVEKALKEFKNLELIRKEYPLDQTCNANMSRQLHPVACQAAYFAKCAGKQGKFWEAAELLHKNYRYLSDSSMANFAQLLKLDDTQLKSCMASDEVKEAVVADIQEGRQDGVSGTPGFMINGRKYSGALPYPQLRQILIDAGAKS